MTDLRGCMSSSSEIASTCEADPRGVEPAAYTVRPLNPPVPHSRVVIQRIPDGMPWFVCVSAASATRQGALPWMELSMLG